MNPKVINPPGTPRARCPVCHETVYSRSGIHPQCAVRQSEPPRVKEVANASTEVDAATATESSIR